MLALERTIIDTHDDYTPWSDCVVGFEDDGDFVVRYTYIDYDDSDNDYRLDARVKKEDALRMALFLDVHLIGLPQYIEKKFDYPLDSSTSGEVKSVFDMLLDFVASCHVRYRLRRTTFER